MVCLWNTASGCGPASMALALVSAHWKPLGKGSVGQGVSRWSCGCVTRHWLSVSAHGEICTCVSRQPPDENKSASRDNFSHTISLLFATTEHKYIKWIYGKCWAHNSLDFIACANLCCYAVAKVYQSMLVMQNLPPWCYVVARVSWGFLGCCYAVARVSFTRACWPMQNS